MKVLIFNKNREKLILLSKLMKELRFNSISVSEEKENFIKTIVENKKDSYVLFSVDEKDTYFKTEALLLGIDDYILSDFKIEELIAKIKSIVRILTRKINKENSGILSIYDLSLNSINRVVTREGREIELTNTEFLLLEHLLRNKNRVITREMIAEKIWNIDNESDSNIVDVYINFLRRKIDKNYDKKIIKTVRGLGYIIKEV